MPRPPAGGDSAAGRRSPARLARSEEGRPLCWMRDGPSLTYVGRSVRLLPRLGCRISAPHRGLCVQFSLHPATAREPSEAPEATAIDVGTRKWVGFFRTSGNSAGLSLLDDRLSFDDWFTWRGLVARLSIDPCPQTPSRDATVPERPPLESLAESSPVNMPGCPQGRHPAYRWLPSSNWLPVDWCCQGHSTAGPRGPPTLATGLLSRHQNC